ELKYIQAGVEDFKDRVETDITEIKDIKDRVEAEVRDFRYRVQAKLKYIESEVKDFKDRIDIINKQIGMSPNEGK
ncbi:MAG: hypothetical protein ACFFCW_42160, partial [Candidatus Hodarchaeota archaeon]